MSGSSISEVLLKLIRETDTAGVYLLSWGGQNPSASQKSKRAKLHLRGIYDAEPKMTDLQSKFPLYMDHKCVASYDKV